MGWIKERILAEKRKHEKSELDWARMAEIKILMTMLENDSKRSRMEILNFEVFIDSNISGKFVINPIWLEHLLNLFYQGYIGEVWEEIQDTLINHKDTIENTVYGIIGQEFSKSNKPNILENNNQ